MKRSIPAFVLAVGLAAVSPQAAHEGEGKADAPAPMLKAGDPAPAFSLPGSDGRTHALADHAQQRAVVIAWFPKAFTGG